MFFQRAKNIIQFAHYLLTIFSLILWLIDEKNYPYFPVVISFRLLWIFRFFLFIDSFRKLIRIFTMALPSFVALIFLIYLITYIYALIGMELFGYISQSGDGINGNSNFTNFGVSMMTLFRVSVGENWADILVDLGKDLSPTHICKEYEHNYDNWVKYGFTHCGKSAQGNFFLISFYIIISFIFFNLLIAILLDAFEITHKQEESLIKSKHIKRFRKIWSRYDKEGNGMIEITELNKLTKEIGSPLGPPTLFVTSRAVRYIIGNLQLPVYFKRNKTKPVNQRTKYFNYFDVLLALSRNALILHGGRKYKQ